MLYTRDDKNIDETALNFLEDSLDLNEFTGLFTNKTVKQVLDMIVKHFVEAIRKQKIKQQEAELLLHFAVVNFQCDNSASQSIKQGIIDTITHANATLEKTRTTRK